MSTNEAPPFACDMSAIPAAVRQEHVTTMGEIFGRVREIRELPDGYAFRVDWEEDILQQIASFVARERLCCPFFGFMVELEPMADAVWLSLTGRQGVKPFIRMEIGEALRRPIKFD